MKDYSMIIDHEHYQSKKRPHMPLLSRAAQFAPFAALSGFDKAVNEAQRQTSEKSVLGDDSIQEIDRTLQYAMFSQKPISITYYIPDPTKPGGSYITVTGCIHKMDMLEDVLIMDDGSVILLYNITDASIVND